MYNININIEESASASPPIVEVEDGWNNRATVGNRLELRFLKKEFDSKNTKTNTDKDKESRQEGQG